MSNDNPENILERALSVPEAERQLVELVRGEDAERFVLTVYRAGPNWAVTTFDPSTGMTCHGVGLSFADAWHTQHNPLLGGPLLTPEEARQLAEEETRQLADGSPFTPAQRRQLGLAPSLSVVDKGGDGNG